MRHYYRMGRRLLGSWSLGEAQDLVKPGGRHPGDKISPNSIPPFWIVPSFSQTLSYFCIYKMLLFIFIPHFKLCMQCTCVAIYMACQKCVCSLQSMSERPMLLQFFIVMAFFTLADQSGWKYCQWLLGWDAECANWDFCSQCCTPVQWYQVHASNVIMVGIKQPIKCKAINRYIVVCLPRSNLNIWKGVRSNMSVCLSQPFSSNTTLFGTEVHKAEGVSSSGNG